ncbi:hypothetical protein [Mesorhizobium sp. ORS 3428]|uniref:hypothetical protein n=1 Tax=Mesorhizobium sp. ORS 3428 TaxID=540997 RepID=UPI0008DAA36F|nr:hypothetical protein [Mesorhizobium sp. ORS 3428]OHV82542.1 hypothetical protein ORS3428_27295 [Mesorhizobium sp. ORS 3428]
MPKQFITIEEAGETYVAELTSQFRTNDRRIDRYGVRWINEDGNRDFLCFADCTRSWTLDDRKLHIRNRIAETQLLAA